MRMLRWMCGVTMLERITNVYTWRSLGVVGKAGKIKEIYWDGIDVFK